jgi:endonuclease/exonuclease/phosphatase family metal-dependent hydrolase
VCIYAPVDRAAREALYSALGRRRPVGAVLLGGDFNCSLHSELDRSHPDGDSHDSPMLQRLLHRWSIVDSATADMIEAAADGTETDFHGRSHTYWYRLPDGRQASSRLDRWYVSDAHYTAVVSTAVAPPCSRSDHDAVYLRLGQADPGTRRRRTGRRALRYPPPAYGPTGSSWQWRICPR